MSFQKSIIKNNLIFFPVQKKTKNTNTLIRAKTCFSKKNFLENNFLFPTEASYENSKVAILTAIQFSTANNFVLILACILKILWPFEEPEFGPKFEFFKKWITERDLPRVAQRQHKAKFYIYELFMSYLFMIFLNFFILKIFYY